MTMEAPLHLGLFKIGKTYKRDDLYNAADEFLEEDGVCHSGRRTAYFKVLKQGKVKIVANFTQKEWLDED